MTTTTPSPPPGPPPASGTSRGTSPGTTHAPSGRHAPGAPVSPSPAQPPGPPGRRSLSAWCVDRRWRTLLAGAAVIAAGVMLMASGGIRTGEDSGPVGDSAVAERIADNADFGDVPTENVVVTKPGGRFDEADTRELSAALTKTFTGVRGVAEVGEPTLSPDGGTIVVPVALAAAADDDAAIDTAVRPMIDVTQRFAAEHPGLLVGQVGDGSINVQVDEQLDKDFQRAELFSLPVTLAILLIAFGAVVAAGIPLLLGVGAVATAMGITAWVSREFTPVDDATSSLLLLIGLAVGVDYALFVLRRSREERALGHSPRDAVKRAGATAGRAVVISGVTVVVAMSGMLVAGGLFTSLAIGALAVVAVAILASATVLPALLSVLGDKVEKLRLPIIGRRRMAPDPERSMWGRLAGRVVRRPVAWTIAAGAVLLALAAPALGMHTGLPGDESLPKSMPVVEAYGRLKAAFPQEGSTVDLVVEAPAAQQERVAAALRSAFPAAQRTGEVAGTEPDLDVSTDKRVTVLRLAVPHDQSDAATDQAVDRIRADVLPVANTALAEVPGAPQAHVGGAAIATDLQRWIDDRLPWVVGFVLVLTFVVMLVSFGSPWLAGATVALNLLSVGAAYGVLTLVFQNTWAEGLLDFTSVGVITAWLPLLMFVILFGLSMDYHVFVVSRVREAWQGGASPREAVRLGVARSAGVVTSAAAVMIGVFAIFGTLSQLELKQLGVGLATAILLDATLVRGVLLPAVLATLGERAHTGPRWVPTLHH
jgi:RND superfamily putative drug exporter